MTVPISVSIAARYGPLAAAEVRSEKEGKKKRSTVLSVGCYFCLEMCNCKGRSDVHDGIEVGHGWEI